MWAISGVPPIMKESTVILVGPMAQISFEEKKTLVSTGVLYYKDIYCPVLFLRTQLIFEM